MIRAVALSGGGLRATLFHIGVISYLRDVKMLADLEEISSVSGGSILAGHLLLNWDRYVGESDHFEAAKAELISFVRKDVRGRIVRRLIVAWWLQPFIRPFLKRRGHNQAPATWLLARYYDRWLYHGATINEVRSQPRLHILSTNLSKGCLTSFGQAQVIHFGAEGASTPINAGLTPLSYAVAASSAYPALFPPIMFTNEMVGASAADFPAQFFTDAGVSDNLGIHAIDTTAYAQRDVKVLVSDAGQSFIEPGAADFGIVKTAIRATDLMMFRIRDFALARTRATAAAIASISDCKESAGTAPRTIQQPLQSIRTDLDFFSDEEIEELIRHGYYTARDAVGVDGANPPIYSLDKKAASIRARRLIAGSRRKRRLFNTRDWASWVMLFTFLLVCAVSGWLIPGAISKVQQLRAHLKVWELVNRVPPPWPLFVKLPVQHVDQLTPLAQDSFTIVQEDRVWDLRQLARDKTTGLIDGFALMTRTATVIRNDDNAVLYAFWFETSGDEFAAQSPNTDFPLELKTPRQPILNGTTRVRPWELTLNVSSKPLHTPFAVVAHTTSKGGFKDRSAWWIGMKVTQNVEAASMRILFPKELKVRNPDFSSYPVGTSGQAQTFEGTALNREEGQELAWRVERPRKNWVYRVQWDW